MCKLVQRNEGLDEIRGELATEAYLTPQTCIRWVG
jgi:hypothetical protein